MDNTTDVGDNQPKGADEIDSERKEVTEDAEVAESREQKEENPNVDETVEQNTEKSSNVEAAEEPGEVPSVVGEAEQSGEKPGVNQAGYREGDEAGTTEAAEQEHEKSSNVEGEDKPGGEPGGEPGVVGGGEPAGDKPRVDEAGDQKGGKADVPGTAQQQGDMAGITTTGEQTTADGTMLGDGQVMETKEGGKGKKGKGGKKGKEKKKKKKGKKKKGKKLSKKELARLKQQLKEFAHQQKIETRARRQKEMEQRRKEYIQTLKEREEKLDEEMALRAVHLPQSVNIFTEQDEQFSKWEFEQKDKNEWETFLRCDPLPLPYDVPGLNTYLYLWREEKNVFFPLEDKQERIKEVLKLLNMIDDYLDNPVGATKRLISLMEEVRDDIRSELQLHLDMSSYVVLRQIDQMEGEGRALGEPEVRRYKCAPSPDIALHLWAAVVPSSTTAFEPAPDSAYACDFPDLGVHVQLPPHAVQPEEAGVPRPQLALRALHLAHDHYSSRCATDAQPHYPEEFTMSMLEAMEKESEERVQQKEETEAIVKSLEREAGLRKASEAPESAPPPPPAEAPVRESQAYLFAPLTNKPFPDPRLDDLVDELEPEETDYLRTENGRKFWEMIFMSERELVNVANEENFMEKVNSMKPPWAGSLKTKYDERAEKYGVIIPPHSIAFGHRLDPERREVIQKRQLKSGPVLEDILASKERIREAEERGADEEEGAGKGAMEASAPSDDLVTKPAEVLFEESDAEYSESSEESLPVFQKIQRHKMAQKEEEDPLGGEGRKESRAVVLETESSSPGPSSYGPSSAVSETGDSLQGETSTTLGSSEEEESESEYSTSDSDATATGATTASEGEWSPSGEMDTSDSDAEGDVAWRRDWSKRKAKGGKKTSKKGSPKKGKKAGGKKKSPKKGSPGKKKKGKGKKKKGKKKGKKKKKKKSPKSSPLTPKTPEDPWLIEERDAVEREKEKEKEYVRELREEMAVVDLKPGELNLRRFAILGGVTHLDLLMHPPQPYQMYDSTITLTERALLVVSKTLRELDISDSTLYDANNLIRLLSSFCGNDSSLQDLGLACLGLNLIPFLALKQVNHTLRYLSLYGNNFHTIDKFSFPVMSQLLELDLRYCNIKTIEVSAFKNLPRVKTLLLSNNRITNVDRIFSDLKSLEYLDFGHNLGLKTSQDDADPSKVPKFTVASDDEELSVIIFPPSLRTLDLSYTKIEILGRFTFHGLSNLVNLSLCHCRLSSILNHSQPFADLKNLQILDMSGNPWLETNLADWIFEGLDSLRELYLDSISNGKNYGYDSQSFAKSNSNSQFSKIPNLRLLSAKHNYIHTLSTSIFLPLTKLETLYLSNNHLISWDSPLFSNNKNLKTLTLHQNQISHISNVMLEEFTKLSEISLYGNPILCNCEVWKFAMLANKGYITVVDWKEVNSYMCIENSKILYESFDGNWSKECEQEDHTVNPREGNSSDTSGMSASTRTNSIVYVVIVTIFSTAIMVYFVQKKGKYVKYFGGLIKNFTVKSLMSDAKSNFSHAYNYDVFVSYCDHDRNWVLNELLPQLEMKNNRADDSKQPGPAFKVCLHERDFQVGSSIMDNIISCMDNSRMILLVVSSPFLRSQWCQFEMHIAQHRLLESRQDDLLLVLLEEIPRNKRPKTLHYLMTTKTYLLWNEEMRDIFWKRLRRAIKPNPSEKEKSISSFP